MTADNIQEPIQFIPDAALTGCVIRVGEAAEKYGIGQRTLSMWAEKGIVKIVEQSPKMLMLDEASVARAVGIFKAACQYTNRFRAGWILKRSIA